MHSALALARCMNNGWFTNQGREMTNSVRAEPCVRAGGFTWRGWGVAFSSGTIFILSYNFHLDLDDIFALLPGWHDWPPVAATCRSPADFGGLPSGPLGTLLEWRLFYVPLNVFTSRTRSHIVGLGCLFAVVHTKPLAKALLVVMWCQANSKPSGHQ